MFETNFKSQQCRADRRQSFLFLPAEEGLSLCAGPPEAVNDGGNLRLAPFCVKSSSQSTGRDLSASWVNPL